MRKASKSRRTVRSPNQMTAHRRVGIVLSAAVVSVVGMKSAVFAADTAATFATSATDLSVGTNYSPNIPPTAASAYDIDLTGTYGTTILNANGSALVFGTLNDLDTTQTPTLSNSNATAASITLSTLGNSIAVGSTGGSASDLIFVQNGGTLNIGNGAGSLGIVLGVGSGNFDVGGTATNANGTLNISSVISGASGYGFTKAGYGVLILGGANTYSGNTYETNGQIRLASSSVGTAGTIGSNGSLTSSPLGTGALLLTAQFESLDLGGQTMGNRFIISASNDSIGNSSASTGTISGAMDGSLVSNVISDFSIGGSNGNIVVTGLMSRTNGSFGITKTGSDTVTYEGIGSNAGVATSSDQVKVSAGTLVLGMTGTSAGAFGDSVTVQGGTLQFAPLLGTVSGGSPWGGQINSNLDMTSGTIDLNGSSGQNSRQQQFYGTGGTVTNSSATPGVIGISARSSNVYSFAGTIQDGAGTTGVDFNASGTSGSGRINEFTGVNTYSGPTSVSYGCFELGSALASQNSVITVNAASGLGTSGTNLNNGASTIAAITPGYALAFAGSIGTFTIGGLSGAGTFALTDIGYSSSFVAGTAATVSLQLGSSLATNASPAAFTGVISDGTVAGGTVTKVGTSTETFSGNNTYTGATSINNGILSVGTVNTGTSAQPLGENASLNLGGASTFGTLQYTGTGGTLDKAIVPGAAGGGIATSTVTSTLTLSGVISGTGSLAINNTSAGTVQLSNGSNTIPGGTVIQSGLVYTGSGTGFGTGTITLGASSGSNSATARWNTGTTVTNPIIVAAGSTGTLKLSSIWGGGGSALSGAITLNNNVTFGEDFTSGSNTWTIGGPITGTGNITIANAVSGTGNAVKFGGSNSFTGGVTVTNGSTLYTTANALSTVNPVAVDLGSQLNSSAQSLNIAGLNDGASGTGSVVISNSPAQVLTLGGSGSFAFSGPLTNSGSLKKSGSGTQALTGSSSYSGTTTISGGTLSLSDSANTTVLAGTSQLSITGGALKLVSAASAPQLISVSAPWSITDSGTTSVTPLVYLNFSGSGTGNGSVAVENVFSLSIDGVNQVAGLYGVGATNPNSDFGGTGEINVINSTPEPTVACSLALAGGMSLLRRRRRPV